MTNPDHRSFAVGCLAFVLLASGCGSDAPAACPPPVTCPSAPMGIPTVVGDSPRAVLALETAELLFARDFGPVRVRFTDALSKELSDDKLAAIMTGLVQAHGPPLQVMDAWSMTVREGEVEMPAAQVIIRMTNMTRLALIIVLEPDGATRGLWIRPV